VCLGKPYAFNEIDLLLIKKRKSLSALRGCIFGGILEMFGSISPTLSPSRLGMDPSFAFGMTCGAEKWL